MAEIPSQMKTFKSTQGYPMFMFLVPYICLGTEILIAHQNLVVLVYITHTQKAVRKT